jgi:chromosome segregation ATPase
MILYYSDQLIKHKEDFEKLEAELEDNNKRYKKELADLEGKQEEVLENLLSEYKRRSKDLELEFATSKQAAESESKVIELGEEIEGLRYSIKKLKEGLKVFEYGQYDFIETLFEELEQKKCITCDAINLIESEASRLRILRGNINKEIDYLEDEKEITHNLLEDGLDKRGLLLCGFDSYEDGGD